MGTYDMWGKPSHVVGLSKEETAWSRCERSNPFRFGGKASPLRRRAVAAEVMTGHCFNI